MSRDNATLLADEYVKGLLAVLRTKQSQNGKAMMRLICQVAEMEDRLTLAMEELTALRQELQTVKSHPLKEAVQALETRLAALRERLAALKADVIEACQHTLADFRARGVEALNSVASFLHLKPGLDAMRAGLDESIRFTEKTLTKIETVSTEYHEAGRHLKNMGRTVRGKEPVREVKPGGRLMKALQAPLRAEHACLTAVKSGLEKAIDGLNRLERSIQEKPSIVKTVREQPAERPPLRVKVTRRAPETER